MVFVGSTASPAPRGGERPQRQRDIRGCLLLPSHDWGSIGAKNYSTISPFLSLHAMKAFQLAALLLSSGVLGAPTGSQGGDVVSAPNAAESDAVEPIDDSTAEDGADPSITALAGDSAADDATGTEQEDDPELTVTPSAGAEAGSEGASRNTTTYNDDVDDDDIVSGDSGDSTGGDSVTDDTAGDTSGDGGSKGFRSVLYFTNWLVPAQNIFRRDVLTE